MALSAREKMLVGGLTGAALLVATYTFVHEPFTTRRAEARERLEQVETELLREQKRLAREGDLAERKAQVTAREQAVDSWVPGKNSAALLIWHLSQAEILSGAEIRGIKAGEKSVVNVAEQQPSGQSQGEGGSQPPSGQAEDPLTSLVMIPLEMKVDAKFAEHLIFNQYLEEAPLFLNIHGLELVRAGQPPIERASDLVQSGNPWLAEQLLNESPPVDGLYRLNLYFKAAKPGPSTEEMHFDSPPGRIDPFVMAAVDEFIAMLQEYFADPGGGGSRPPADGPAPPGPPQLG
ncbi:MAG: hypothetical protein ACOY93_06690 [Bacillota bacterium]